MTTNADAKDSQAHVVVRQGIDRDWPLLCSSFANQYCKDSRSFYGYRVPPHTLVTKLEQFRTAPNWQLLTACPASNHDEVMGLLLHRKASVNPRAAVAWITVKALYQGVGVATALLKQAGIVPNLKKPVEIDCAFLLPHVAQGAASKGLTLRFRPYLPDVELWEELSR